MAQSPRNLDIINAWIGVSAWMVVHEHDCASAIPDCWPVHLSGTQSRKDEQQFHKEAIGRLRDEYVRLSRRQQAACVDKLDGNIDLACYEKLSTEWRAQMERIERQIARHEDANQTYLAQGAQLMEFASRAYDLFLEQPVSEKRRLLNCVLSNCHWKDGTLTASYRQPFGMLADTNEAWREKKTVEGPSADPRPVWLPE